MGQVPESKLMMMMIRVKKESFKSNLILGFSSPLSSHVLNVTINCNVCGTCLQASNYSTEGYHILLMNYQILCENINHVHNIFEILLLPSTKHNYASFFK